MHLIYVFLDNPEACIERIKMRVKKGGHYIPEEDVRRRYARSMHHFWTSYKNKVDAWTLYYNGGEKMELVAVSEEDKIDILDKALYNVFIEGLK